MGVGNPFSGINHRKAQHCVELIYIHDCFSDALPAADESLPDFRVTNGFSGLVKAGMFSEKFLPSMLCGSEPLWQGKCSVAGTPTSKAIMELAPPKRTVADVLKALLQD
ncbi:hypothetical protein N7467_005316 [Penicillium canescens]|nr:hypothetical protein N7467_005316 [Penicillium canescens]